MLLKDYLFGNHEKAFNDGKNKPMVDISGPQNRKTKVRAEMTHFLKTDSNPEGYKLEDILILLRKDLLLRALKIAEDRRPEALTVMQNDMKILSLLSEAVSLSIHSSELLNRSFGPSKTGKPRIGSK